MKNGAKEPCLDIQLQLEYYLWINAYFIIWALFRLQLEMGNMKLENLFEELFKRNNGFQLFIHKILILFHGVEM